MKRLFVAPHLDDGAISFGGTLLAERAAGSTARTTVATVMTVSKFSKHGIGDVEEISALRQAEERSAMTTVDAEVTFLGFGECLPRGYTIRDTLDYPREIRSDLDPRTVTDIARALGPLFTSFDEILVPLAVGPDAHVDHRIVRLAAAAAVRERPDLRLLLYEDIPYIDETIRGRVSALPEVRPAETRIDLAAKLRLCRGYESQPVEAWVDAICRAAGDPSVERTWVVSDPRVFETLAPW